MDESVIINETYKISNTNCPFIYHLNYKYIGILDKQNSLFQKISFINKDSYILSKIYKEIYQKSINTLSLTSNAYKNIMFSYNNIIIVIFLQIIQITYFYMNSIISSFLDSKVEFLNKKIPNILIGFFK